MAELEPLDERREEEIQLIKQEITGSDYIRPEISFEDAWERELKYRKRIKRSLQSSTSSGLLPASSQELPPNPNVDDRKTRTITLSMFPMKTVYPSPSQKPLLLLPKEQQQQTSAQEFNKRQHSPQLSPGPFYNHSQSLPTQRPHLAPEFKYNQIQASSSQVEPVWCRLCKVPCMNEFSYNQHCQGKSHKFKQVQGLGSSSNLLKPRCWCSLCEVQCTSEFNYEQHCQGRSHKCKVQGLEPSSGTLTHQIWCSLCEVLCMNEFNYEQHCQGKKHVLRLIELGLHAADPPRLTF